MLVIAGGGWLNPATGERHDEQGRSLGVCHQSEWPAPDQLTAQLAALCDGQTVVFGRSEAETAWLIHSAMTRGKGKTLLIAGIHVPAEEADVYRAAEVDFRRGEAHTRRPTTAEVEAMRQKPVHVELITEEQYLALARCLTSESDDGMTRH